MADIVITEFMDPPAVAELAAEFDTHYDPSLVDQPEQLIEQLADCRALVVRNRTQVREPLLHRCPALRVVGRLGVGLDNIDVDICEKRGIRVMPASGANTIAVAEYVVATMLLLTRGAYTSSAEVANGEWPRQRLMNGGEVHGRTLGLIGFGAIAQAVAARTRPLGMTILAYDPYLPAADSGWQGAARADTLAALLTASDVVSLHLPLTEDTRGMIDGTALKQMKPTAVLINTARGGIVDEAALVDALRHDRLAGAALDVLEQEPLAAGSVLSDAPNLLLTPHIAGLSRESNQRVSLVTANNVRRALTELG